MDIKLGNTGLLFTTDLVLTSTIQEKVAQRLSVRFKTLLGTWFMDTTFGLDYLNNILGKGRTKLSIDAIIRKEILKDKYVKTITSFESEVVDRTYVCRFSVLAIDAGTTKQAFFLLNENGLILTDENGNAVIF